MDETGFAELEQAAVAGAEGTAWGMPEFVSETPVPQVPCYSSFSSTSPFDSFRATENIPIKQEPSFFNLHPVPSSPPQQASLCSIESEESFVHTALDSAPFQRPVTPVPLPCVPRLLSPSQCKTRKRPATVVRVTKASLSDSFLSKEDMVDLKGTTAARSRKMTEEERRIMLHKRRLRNRASAARSREKRSRTLNDLSTEVEELMKKAADLAEQARTAVEESRQLKARNAMLVKENELLKSELKL